MRKIFKRGGRAGELAQLPLLILCDARKDQLQRFGTRPKTEWYDSLELVMMCFYTSLYIMMVVAWEEQALYSYDFASCESLQKLQQNEILVKEGHSLHLMKKLEETNMKDNKGNKKYC